jgi:cytochrome c-type biogenesis protein
MKARAALAAAALAALAAAAAAQDAPPAPPAPSGDKPIPAAPAAEKPAPSDPLHVAWTAVLAARDGLKAAGRDAGKRKAASDVYKAASRAFLDVFVGADWKAIDAEKDRDLLTSGLTMAGSKALEAKDGAAAVKAYEFYASAMKGDPNLGFIELYSLTAAYMAAGRMEKAVALWEKHAASSDPRFGPAANVALGDYRCAGGDLEAARALWKKVSETPPSSEGKPDPSAAARADADMRLALVGSAAPEVDSKTWLGGEAQPLSKLKGSVVVLDFWATWCPPCRGVMPDLNRYYGEHRKDGLAVLGITHFYKNGFLPNKGTKEPVTDGESLKDIAEADFPAHLARFKENLGIDYPFVTATDEDFKTYKIRGIPTLFVLDREGKIAFAKVGGGDETLLHMAVERCLKPAK